MRDKPLNQKGFLLVELVIVISISALVVGAAVAVWLQLSSVSARNSDYVVAYSQVQNAGYWFSRDALQITQEPIIINPAPSELVSLTLDWVDWEGNAHQVVYTLEGASGELRRTVDGGSPILVAQHIDSTKTSCTWDEGMLTLEITAQVGERIASRTYKVEPRAFFE